MDNKLVVLYHKCGGNVEITQDYKGFICMACGLEQEFKEAGEDITAKVYTGKDFK